MGARDFFETVRECAIECERTRRQIQRMEAREGMRGGSGSTVSNGFISDPMRATDVRIDYEAAMHARIEADEAKMDEASAILFGRDNRSGLSVLMNSAVADALWWRYLAAESWERTAREVGHSTTWCRENITTAFELMDSVGMEAVIDGKGTAEA